MTNENEGESGLSRWSKRKLAVAREQEIDAEKQTEAVVGLEEQEARQAELAANREAAEAVDLETLDEKSDFSIFLKEGVPELLKKQAMLTLWRSNPVFANVDGLVDYDDDFGSPDLIMKTFKSAYQAGRGYLEHIEREEKAKAAAAVLEDSEGAESAADDEDVSEEFESEETVSDEEMETDVEETVSLEDAEDVVEESMEYAEVEEEFEPLPSEQPAPRMSLRKRFEL